MYISKSTQVLIRKLSFWTRVSNAAVGSLLTGWGFTASPALRMRAASPDIQP